MGAPDVAAAPALVPFLLDFEADAVGELAGKDGFVKSESYSAGTLSVSTAAPLAGTKSVYATTQAGNRTIYHRSFEVPLTLGMGYMVALKSKVNTPSFGIQSWVSVAALSGADDGVSAPANDASAAWGLIFTNGAPAPKFLTVRLAAGTTNVAVNFSTVKSLLIRVDAAGLADVLVDGAPVVSGAVVAANHPITRLVVMALTSGSLSEFAGLDDIQLAP